MRTNGLQAPTSIQLTTEEQAELRSRSFPPFGELPTIANYWLGIYAVRGIVWPANKLPVAVPTAPGAFTIAWHAKPLGREAIAAGRAFRALHEAKDREFAERQRAQGRF